MQLREEPKPTMEDLNEAEERPMPSRTPRGKPPKMHWAVAMLQKELKNKFVGDLEGGGPREMQKFFDRADKDKSGALPMYSTVYLPG